MTRILKLERDDAEREAEFDLDYLLSLTRVQRYKIMLRLSTHALERMIRHGYLKPVEIIKRPAHTVRGHRRERFSHTRLRPRNRGH